MWRRIAIGVVVVLVAVAGFIATRPSEFRIARSRTLAAEPAQAFAYVNDFERWPEWSPYEARDPSMKREIGGAPAGRGATYHWTGNDEVGEGRMTIMESRAPELVTIRLEFIRPFPATNTARFELLPSGRGTHVTWSMVGRNDFMGKAASLFIDVDALVGADFEKGLEKLDAVTSAAD